MLEIFGKFSFVIIASYASSIFLITALVIQTLISKVKTDKELKKKEFEKTRKKDEKRGREKNKNPREVDLSFERKKEYFLPWFA